MNKKGFTLIELLIVVVIIGILAAIAIPKFGESRKQAFISAMRSDLNQLKIAQEIWFNSVAGGYEYTDDLTELEFNPTANVDIDITSATADAWAATATHSNASGWECTYDSDVGVIECEET